MIYKTLHRKLKIEEHLPHKDGGELRCPDMVSSSRSLMAPVALLVICHERGMGGMVIETNGTYP